MDEERIKAALRPPYDDLLKQLNDEKSRSFRLSRRVAETQSELDMAQKKIQEITSKMISKESMQAKRQSTIEEIKEIRKQIKKLKSEKLKLKQKVEFLDEL